MQAISEMHPVIRKQFEDGQENEKRVREWLEELGYETKDVPKDWDYRLDIDCLARKKGVKNWVRVSIKCNLPKYFQHGFIFELEKYGKREQRWSPSWYSSGQADVYVVWKRNHSGGGELWVLKKADIKEYVELNGWDYECGLRPEVLAEQQHHNQCNTRLGAIQKQNALDTKVARMIASKEKW